jgi:hypothetical protein
MNFINKIYCYVRDGIPHYCTLKILNNNSCFIVSKISYIFESLEFGHDESYVRTVVGTRKDKVVYQVYILYTE